MKELEEQTPALVDFKRQETDAELLDIYEVINFKNQSVSSRIFVKQNTERNVLTMVSVVVLQFVCWNWLSLQSLYLGDNISKNSTCLFMSNEKNVASEI